MKVAFVLVHFGSNIKYFELELYFLYNLLQHTEKNVVYMHSQDTPPHFINTINILFPTILTIQYDNSELIDSSYVSCYTHFNILLTCSFVYANILESYHYDLICLLESDMYITKNIDSIFELKYPAILNYLASNTNSNELLKFPNKPKILEDSVSGSSVNGGVMLFKPIISKIPQYLKAIPKIIESKSKFPNETLFIYCNDVVYNIPMKYNLSHYHLHMNAHASIYHFNSTEYKPLHFIKDNWKDKNKKKQAIVDEFRDKVYTPHSTLINFYLSEGYIRSNINDLSSNLSARVSFFDNIRYIYTFPTYSEALYVYMQIPTQKILLEYIDLENYTDSRFDKVLIKVTLTEFNETEDLSKVFTHNKPNALTIISLNINSYLFIYANLVEFTLDLDYGLLSKYNISIIE